MALTNVPAEVIGSQILILNSGRFFAVLNNSCKLAGTLANVVHLTKVKSEERREIKS